VQGSEIHIVRRAKRSEQGAFHQLFERYRLPLLRFLHAMAGCSDLAQDLAQETVLRAFKLLPTLREESKFSSWLFSIARNVAREQTRRAVRIRVDLEGAVMEQISDPGPNPELSAMKQQLYRAVSRGLAKLDEDGRTVLALRVLAGKRYEEIAEITGWTLAKVKVELHRARLEMRKTIRPYMVE